MGKEWVKRFPQNLSILKICFTLLFGLTVIFPLASAHCEPFALSVTTPLYLSDNLSSKITSRPFFAISTDHSLFLAGLSGINERQARVMKINAKGELLWEKELGKGSDITTLAADRKGGVLVGLFSKEDFKARLVSLNSKGEEKWSIKKFSAITKASKTIKEIFPTPEGSISLLTLTATGPESAPCFGLVLLNEEGTFLKEISYKGANQAWLSRQFLMEPGSCSEIVSLCEGQIESRGCDVDTKLQIHSYSSKKLENTPSFTMLTCDKLLAFASGQKGPFHYLSFLSQDGNNHILKLIYKAGDVKTILEEPMYQLKGSLLEAAVDSILPTPPIHLLVLPNTQVVVIDGCKTVRARIISNSGTHATSQFAGLGFAQADGASYDDQNEILHVVGRTMSSEISSKRNFFWVKWPLEEYNKQVKPK